MSRLVALALVLAMAHPAVADVTETLAVPKRSFGLGLMMGASSFAGVDEGGAGPSVELALGSHRHQYFGEAGFSVVGVNVRDDSHGAALSTRAAGGIRWLPRSFRADSASIDLLLEAFAGVEHLRWSGGGNLTRPQLGGGAGWQVRNGRSNFTIRLSTRIFVSPTSNDAVMAVCRGTCPGAAAMTNYGFLGMFGVAW